VHTKNVMEGRGIPVLSWWSSCLNKYKPLAGGKSKSSPSLNVKGERYVTPVSEEHGSVIIRILLIMVTSHIFHLYGLDPQDMLVEGDYFFDVGEYF